MLLAGAGLIVLGGTVFALTGRFVPLLLAATVGVISPSGNEVGPFLAIEQAALAQTVGHERRTQLFAWYHLAGSLATAAGFLVCGAFVQALEKYALDPLQSYRAVLFAYAGAGLLLVILFLRLTPNAEAPVQVPGVVPGRRIALGLHRSRGVVLKLSALFALDAFAGGFVLQSVMAYWFHVRFGADPATLGGIFFVANLLAAFSALAAAPLAQRFGLLNTMVFTHAPSNVLLALVPFMPTLPWAVAVLLVRFAISQMDVPTRQSYTVAVVNPEERSAAAGATGVARTAGAALAPALTGLLLATPVLAGSPFIVAGALKLVYDGLLYHLFRSIKPPEETAPHAEQRGRPR
jgi:MFS family permease